MSSPFDKKGGTAAKSRAAAGNEDIPTPTNIGADKPVGKSDPFAVAAPSGITGRKALHFLGQLVVLKATEHGEMKTSSNTTENPTSEFVRFDIIPVTAPEVYEVTDNFGEIEEFDPYEVGERQDDVLVFNKPLVREGKRALDRGITWLIGRIERGDKKPGQSRPIILVEATTEDIAIYEEAVKAGKMEAMRS